MSVMARHLEFLGSWDGDAVFERCPHDSDTEDVAILAEVHGGDLQRFDLFVDRYKTRLVRYLHQRVGDVDAAEDLAQEIFVKVFRNPAIAAKGARISTWLFTLARNAATDHLRWRQRRQKWFVRHVRLTARNSSIDPAMAASLEEDRVRIGALFKCLPEEQREVLTLRILGDLSLAEISEVTGVNLATVKSRLRYGLSKISEILPKEDVR